LNELYSSAIVRLEPVEVLARMTVLLLLERAFHALELHVELRAVDPEIRHALEVGHQPET
jgi:hypothetical protein